MIILLKKSSFLFNFIKKNIWLIFFTYLINFTFIIFQVCKKGEKVVNFTHRNSHKMHVNFRMWNLRPFPLWYPNGSKNYFCDNFSSRMILGMKITFLYSMTSSAPYPSIQYGIPMDLKPKFQKSIILKRNKF